METSKKTAFIKLKNGNILKIPNVPMDADEADVLLCLNDEDFKTVKQVVFLHG